MSEDYAKGFKDGFAAGLEEGKKLTPKTQPKLDDYVFGQPDYLGMQNTCHVCGRLQSGIEGYVCFSPRCPSMATSYSIGPTDGPVTGAVGAELKPEDYHPDWIGKWGDRDRGR